jgi:hypothetical protein
MRMRPEIISPPPDRFRDLTRAIALILAIVAVGVGVVAGAALAFDYVARPAPRLDQSAIPAPASSDSEGTIRFHTRWAAPPICVFNVSASQIDYVCASER